MDRNALLDEFEGYMADRLHSIPPEVMGDEKLRKEFVLACAAVWAAEEGHDRSLLLYPLTQGGMENLANNPGVFLETLPPLFESRLDLAREALPAFLSLVKRDPDQAIDPSVHDHLHDAFWDFMCERTSRRMDEEWRRYSVARKGLAIYSDGPVIE